MSGCTDRSTMPRFRLLGAELRVVDFHPYGLELGHDAQPECFRCAVSSARTGDQDFDRLLDAELAQAGRALVQVLPDHVPAVRIHFTVEVEIDLFDDLATVGLVWAAAAHVPASPARTRPRSTA